MTPAEWRNVLEFNTILAPGNNEFNSMVIIGNVEPDKVVQSITKQRLYANKTLLKRKV
jgi:hypothetical protein